MYDVFDRNARRDRWDRRKRNHNKRREYIGSKKNQQDYNTASKYRPKNPNPDVFVDFARMEYPPPRVVNFED